MDLDGFKGVNDTLGHDVGDLLLVEVARRLSSRIRLSDLVARMGGDEFTFVLEPLRDPEDLRRIAEAIRSIFESPFDLAGRPIRITGSLGGAVFPDHAPDLQGLLKAADLAMYRTKERGRDGFTLASDPPEAGALRGRGGCDPPDAAL
jgi:diguanylate cyclase (GGDEF)-like protein